MTVAIDRIEAVSKQMRVASHQRPVSKDVLGYVLDCQKDPTRENPYDDGRFSHAMLYKAKRMVKYIPETSEALRYGYAPIGFEDAYRLTKGI